MIKIMNKEMKWEKCSFEKATGLQNANGDVLPVRFEDWTSSLLSIDGKTAWNKWAVEFAGLTLVKQVEVLPDWVTDGRMVYAPQICFDCRYEGTHVKEIKRRLYDRNVPVFFTPEEAIVAADEQIARNLAELSGDSVTFTHPFLATCLEVFPELDKFQGESIEITVRKLPK